MIRRSSKLPTYLTQAEIRALFAAISNLRDRKLFGLAYAYGLRLSEIVLLDRNDVDLERGRIRIRRLKGGLSGERPIFRNLLPLLRQYLESRRDNAEALFTGLPGQAQEAADSGSLPLLRDRGRPASRSPSHSCASPLGRRPRPRHGRRHRLRPGSSGASVDPVDDHLRPD
jgi:integrase